MRLRESLLAGVVLLSLVGCQAAPPGQASPTPQATATPEPTPSASLVPPPEPTPISQSDVDAMLARFDGTSFPAEELDLMGNGPLFLKIVLTSKDPKIKASAFRSLTQTYGRVLADSTKNFGGDPDFVRAVLLHLDDSNKAIRNEALKSAAHTLGMEPNLEVRSKLVEIANREKDSVIRFLALQSLQKSEIAPSKEMTAARLAALDDKKAFVVASVLHSLDVNDVSDQVMLEKRLGQLLYHPSPAVRGEAAKLMGHLPRQGPRRSLVADKVRPLLTDSHAYPRARAVIALAELEGENSIPSFIKLADDQGDSSYRLEFQDLLGQPMMLQDKTYYWGRVNEAVARTLNRLTHDTHHPFHLGRIFYASRYDDIKHEAKRAKEWYQENKEWLE